MIGESLARKIEAVASAPILLVASDYDGVLSPIVADPAAAVPDQAALSALVKLGRLPGTHAVSISGRSRATLLQLTGAPEEITMIGTHGAEGLDHEVDSEVAGSVERLQTDLMALARQYPGCHIEIKPIGAAFHFRNAPLGDQAARQARRIAHDAGARIISGKKVVECVFGDANKGSALQALRAALDASAVVFLGDDITDEDAFAVLEDGDLGIKVGQGTTVARHRIADQTDVASVLDALVEARSKTVSGSGATHRARRSGSSPPG